MTLIVAIEPDRRQAHYLSAMVHGSLRAELVLGDSAESALRALGDRVPDVILTSALLSPRDESAVADWLRALDTAAAHIQTLTIPVFAASRPRPSRARGVFAALMGSGEDVEYEAPDGCDPAMFAEQCADYLERARAERASHDVADSEEPGDTSEPEEVVEAMKPIEMMAPPPDDPGDPGDFIEFDLSAFLDDPRREPIEPPPLHQPEPVDRIDDTPAPTMPTTGEVWIPPRLGVKRLWPEMEIPDSSARLATSSPQPPARRIPRGRRPIQDEWGFFDPEQCGFAALLAKLAEITEGDDPPAKRPA